MLLYYEIFNSSLYGKFIRPDNIKDRKRAYLFINDKNIISKNLPEEFEEIVRPQAPRVFVFY